MYLWERSQRSYWRGMTWVGPLHGPESHSEEKGKDRVWVPAFISVCRHKETRHLPRAPAHTHHASLPWWNVYGLCLTQVFLPWLGVKEARVLLLHHAGTHREDFNYEAFIRHRIPTSDFFLKRSVRGNLLLVVNHSEQDALVTHLN